MKMTEWVYKDEFVYINKSPIFGIDWDSVDKNIINLVEDKDIKKTIDFLDLKLDCTNNRNVKDIINGLYISQNCHLDFVKKGIKVYVKDLIYKNKERKIIINKDYFIGYIPFRYIVLFNENKDNIKSIKIKKIANKKYNKGKSIIVTVFFNVGIQYKENNNGKNKEKCN